MYNCGFTNLNSDTTFRPPQRVIMPEQKREQWITDLAGTVSLATLAKNIPHG